jgi:hypothetical protein
MCGGINFRNISAARLFMIRKISRARALGVEILPRMRGG